jgi:hypothetical protein
MRYRLNAFGESLQIQLVEETAFPLRAYGFLQHSPKDHPNGELMLEVRGEEIWVWVAERKPEKKEG